MIASLTTCARVNELGFIETPYRKVADGKVSRKSEFLTADVDQNKYIAQANSPVDEEGKFTESLVSCRYKGISRVKPEKVEYMDVSPKQLVSVAAALIPFLEHDDANRALMGSNMQRQSVPLMIPEVAFSGYRYGRKSGPGLWGHCAGQRGRYCH